MNIYQLACTLKFLSIVFVATASAASVIDMFDLKPEFDYRLEFAYNTFYFH